MRLISQDRTLDVPYEDGFIKCYEKFNHTDKTAIFYSSPLCHCGVLLGLYKTQERAIEVMEMLHSLYKPSLVVQNVMINEEVEKTLKNWSVGAVMVKADGENAKYDLITEKIFYFPKDDETE